MTNLQNLDEIRVYNLDTKNYKNVLESVDSLLDINDNSINDVKRMLFYNLRSSLDPDTPIPDDVREMSSLVLTQLYEMFHQIGVSAVKRSLQPPNHAKLSKVEEQLGELPF